MNYDQTFRKLATQSIDLFTEHLVRLLQMKKNNNQLLHVHEKQWRSYEL